MSQANVFVIGLDEENIRTLRAVPHAVEYRFHPLLSVEELQHGEIPVAELLEKAQKQLDAFDGSIDAIVGYWDFPVSTLVPILAERYGTRATSLESVVKCEHKYWSRLEQQKVVDEHPRFALVDLEGEPRPPEGLRFPMWLKPVKSYSSELAFGVKDEEEFAAAVAEIREGITRIGRPFEFVMRRLQLPPEVAEAGGQACLAEESLKGVQAAVEGYVYDGEVTVYGVLDSINYPDTPCFLRHQYPASLPEPVQLRLRDVSRRVIEQIGMDWATFSIEYFYDAATGEISLLEINPRHSQSHAELFEYVDGVPNHHAMLSLAMGRDPDLPYREGPYEVAAKWYHRQFTDGLVTRVPTAEEIERVEREVPGVRVTVKPQEGQRLSDMPGQDSYSFELAHVFVGADSEEEMRAKYDRCLAMLPFEFAEESDRDGDRESGRGNDRESEQAA
ncbi:ATP-grasp domain-containing protein [Streptomyces radiopugnans]|uniref:ATP-grasp domain-containing protein n=1 Tax=Streptomyces radiopugnans TaxID=403935 RepID=A0A1H9H4E1_9ACTN|nr:ATP-grasp domain-containing protein [Streptomyces radiopugnans]SEQ57149.1 ATP-grasp domain-containing protein [Streptomyces radiopugnans]